MVVGVQGESTDVPNSLKKAKILAINVIYQEIHRKNRFDLCTTEIETGVRTTAHTNLENLHISSV